MEGRCPKCNAGAGYVVPDHQRAFDYFTCLNCGHTWTTESEMKKTETEDEKSSRHN